MSLDTSKCLECGGDLRVTSDPHRYSLADDLAITIHGAKQHRCLRCGEVAISYPAVGSLLDESLRLVLGKHGRLAPPEIRFLRRRLGWSGVECASRLGVTPETVSRWEHGSARMRSTADRALRLWVALAEGVQGAGELLRDVARRDVSDKPYPQLSYDGTRWIVVVEEERTEASGAVA